MGTSKWNRRSIRSRADPLKVEVIPPRKSLGERLSQQVPIVISLLALATAICAQLQAIRHSKLSVKPQVEFLLEDNFGAPNVGLFMENNGLGPARIEGLKIYFDGRLVGPLEMDSIYEKTRPIFKTTSPQWYASESAFNLKSGERMGIFFSPPSNIKNAATFRKLVDERIFVVGQACSLYEECHPFCSLEDNRSCGVEEERIRKLDTSNPPKKGLTYH